MSAMEETEQCIVDADELAASIRAVQQISAYHEELKISATDVATRVSAQQRGYFTPNEENETLGLLASYWQSRNALFDLISSLRREAGSISDPDPLCFLVAYAAAILLVDAARFLRETVEHRPIVRDKLNEAVTQLGVPPRVYDTVQKSLVSARHGWHLYHAMQYYTSHRDELRDIAASVDAISLIDIIERLHHRFDVRVSQFASAKLRTRAGQVARRVARSVLGRALYGLQKLGGILVSEKYIRPGHKPSLPVSVAHELSGLLLPGDVLVCRKEYALTNYFLPGYWPHAALYLGNAEQLTTLGIQGHEHVSPRWSKLMEIARTTPGVVLESMKDGVHIRSVNSPFRSDSVVVLRPRLSQAEIARGIARAMVHENKPYDFDFDFRRSDRLVCTEVVYRAFDGLGGMSLPLTTRAGRPTLSGGDLVQLAASGVVFVPAALYAPRMKSEIVRDESATPLMKKLASPKPQHVSPATAEDESSL